MIQPILRSSLRARSTIGAVRYAGISTTAIRRAEVTTLQPQDLVEKSLKPGAEADPQLAGYPELPYVSLQERVAKGWWDNQERRNFGETLHEQEDALSMWSPDVHATPAGWALAQMIMAFSAVAGFGYVVYATMPERKVAKRSYPFEGLKAELGGSELTPKAIPESVEDDE